MTYSLVKVSVLVVAEFSVYFAMQMINDYPLIQTTIQLFIIFFIAYL